MAGMSGGAPTIQIPRWIQLVGLPILALIALLIVGKVFHAVFLFLVAALIALLLEPLVRSLERLRIPRGFSIAIVYLSFAAALVAVVIAVSVIVIDRTQSAANRVDNYLTTESGRPPQTGFERDVDRLQLWLDTHHLERVDVKRQGTDFAQSIKGKDAEKYTTDVIDFLRGAAISIFQLIFGLVLILVVSIYMLLDMSRLKARVDRRFPPSPGQPGLIVQMERAVAGYVRGQVLLSLIIGTSAGVGLWVLGTVGLGSRRRQVRGALRRLGRGDGADPVSRAVARRDPADHLRARRAPDLGALGRRSSSSGSTRSRATSSSRTSWGTRSGCIRCS